MNNGLLLKWNTSLFQIPNYVSLHKTHHSLLSFSTHFPKLSYHLKLPYLCSKTPTFDSPQDDDDDDDIIVPLRQWTRNKPRGFGDGKVYDTTLEDKLLEELEQSRVAQIANINNNPIANSNIPKHKDPPNGIRVRLINLPKKKNIHRDLQAAFKPFTGIINIIPAVSGNEKTRDPVCKGFAFVYFNSQEEANKFVDIISTQPLTFGKVEKQIRCEIMKPSSTTPASVKPSVDRIKSPLPVLDASMSVNSNPVIEDDTLSDSDDEPVLASDMVEEMHEGEAGSEPLKKQKVRDKGKKTTGSEKKVEKTPKLSIPGSAKRLKMKEKALLSGVFSKYGGKSSD